MTLILASSSPQRREILALLGLPFESFVPDFEETLTSHRPAHVEVFDFGLGKALSVAKDHSGSIVIGSDTMILLDGVKIGKPTGVADARQILRALCGKRHRILTSVALIDDMGGPGLRTVEEVPVVMRAYSEEQIERYLCYDESLDKAGAYSIQGNGRTLIESIHGDYLAAMGLPLRPIAAYLTSRGIHFPLDIEKLYAEKSFRNWGDFY